MAELLTDPRHERFLTEYLMVPRKDRPTMTQMASALGVTERTLRSWKERKDIMDAWAERAREGAASPEHLQAVMTQVLKDAQDSSYRQRASAQKLYLEFVKAISPPAPVQVNVGGDASQLSDEQLRQLKAELIEQEFEARKLRLVVNNEGM